VKCIVRRLVVSASVIVLSGCAGVQVRSVGTNTGQAAYDLSGPTLDELAAEAQRLCPQGYAVLRQWQRTNRAPGEADAAGGWVYRSGVFSYDLQPEQAQMSIACKA
jgi:hypothetical protein